MNVKNTKLTGIVLMIILMIPIMLSGIDQKADQVINDYIRLVGGQKALDKILTLEYDYEMKHVLEGKIRDKTIYKKRPDFMRRGKIGATGLGITRGNKHYFQGFNPKIKKWVWRKLPDMDMSNTYILGIFGHFMDYKKRGYDISYVGTITKEGKDIHKLKMILKDKRTKFLYFDAASKKYIGFESKTNPLTKVHGYTKVGRFLIPTISEFNGVSRGRKVHHINTKRNIKINTKIDDHLFDFPTDVQ